MTKEYLKQEASRELSGISLKHIDTLMDNECSDDHYSEYLLEKYIHYIIDQAYQAGQEAERERVVKIIIREKGVPRMVEKLCNLINSKE